MRSKTRRRPWVTGDIQAPEKGCRENIARSGCIRLLPLGGAEPAQIQVAAEEGIQFQRGAGARITPTDRFEVPAQVVPAPAAQSFLPFIATKNRAP